MPHEPAGDAGTDDAEGEFELTANTESFFSSSAPAHDGQLGVCPWRVRYSNWWPQPRQAYSNNGI
jgi:hypothetical protein